jgi:hypothetical protein
VYSGSGAACHSTACQCASLVTVTHRIQRWLVHEVPPGKLPNEPVLSCKNGRLFLSMSCATSGRLSGMMCNKQQCSTHSLGGSHSALHVSAISSFTA